MFAQLTQEEFAERIGVDKMAVSRWERGALRPSDESLAVIEHIPQPVLTGFLQTLLSRLS